MKKLCQKNLLLIHRKADQSVCFTVDGLFLVWLRGFEDTAVGKYLVFISFLFSLIAVCILYL